MPGTPSPQPNTEPHSQKTGSSSTCFGRPPMIRPWLWPHCLFGSPGSSAPAPQMVFAMHPDRQSAFVTQGSSICYRHKLRPVPIDRRCTSSPVLGKPAGSMCPAVRSADTNGQNGPSDRHTRRYRYRAGSQTDHSECAKPAVCAECWRPDHSCPHARCTRNVHRPPCREKVWEAAPPTRSSSMVLPAKKSSDPASVQSLEQTLLPEIAGQIARLIQRHQCF